MSKAININAIGRASSRRLVEVLSAELADAIIKAKEFSDFENFDDLKERVRGIGPKKIELLRAAGFVVVKREGKASAAVEAQPKVSATGILGSLRDDVEALSEQTWTHRHNKCLYTSKKKGQVVKETPEVDHIWEIQVLNTVNQIVSAENVAYRTRGNQETLKTLFNSVENLNVTTHYVNQKKKGPFTKWLHATEHGMTKSIEDCLSESKALDLRDDGTWANIEKAVVLSWDELQTECRTMIRDEGMRRHAKRVLDELNGTLSRMGII